MTDAHVAETVARLVVVQPAVFEQLDIARGLARSRCVLSTRVAIDVLRYFGIAAVPWSVVCEVATPSFRAYRDAVDALPPGAPMPPAPADAYMVAAGAFGSTAADDVRNGWYGHLVAYVPRIGELLDLDLQAFSRPAKGLFCPAAIGVSWPGHDRRCAVEGYDQHGTPRVVVAYERDDENQRFRDGVDWTGSAIGRLLTATIVTTLRRYQRKRPPLSQKVTIQ